MKTCSSCKETFPLEKFYTEPAGITYAACKNCIKIKKQRYYLENKQKILFRTSEYFLKNKEEVAKKHKRYYDQVYSFKRRGRDLQLKYGLTEEQYEQRLRDQNYRCALCKRKDSGRKTSRHFAVDHCHTTGKIRGLLCDYCNRMLGNAKDSISTLKNAVAYLEKLD